MMRKIIKEETYSKVFYDTDIEYNIRFSDIPKHIIENDTIKIERLDVSNEKYAISRKCTRLTVIREREENNYEYAKRIAYNKHSENLLTKKKYEIFLEWKKELEN